MNNRTINVLVAAAACMGITAMASADVVTMKFTGTGKGSSVKVTLGSNSFNTFAGQLKHTITDGIGAVGSTLNGSHVTFCSDLLQNTSGSNKTYTVTGVENLPNWDPMGNDASMAIWNMYNFAGASAIASGASNDLAAAFQIAIWEIVSDFDANVGLASLNVNSGGFKAKKTDGSNLGSGIANQLSSLFAAATGVSSQGSLGLYGLRSGEAQDQIITVVPTPGVGVLAGMGLACFARRRRTAK